MRSGMRWGRGGGGGEGRGGVSKPSRERVGGGGPGGGVRKPGGERVGGGGGGGAGRPAARASGSPEGTGCGLAPSPLRKAAAAAPLRAPRPPSAPCASRAVRRPPPAPQPPPPRAHPLQLVKRLDRVAAGPPSDVAEVRLGGRLVARHDHLRDAKRGAGTHAARAGVTQPPLRGAPRKPRAAARVPPARSAPPTAAASPAARRPHQPGRPPASTRAPALRPSCPSPPSSFAAQTRPPPRLVSVDHDHIGAHVHRRRVRGQVLAADVRRRQRRQAPERLALRVPRVAGAGGARRRDEGRGSRRRALCAAAAPLGAPCNERRRRRPSAARPYPLPPRPPSPPPKVQRACASMMYQRLVELDASAEVG
jgi:hypothetical protein